MQVVYGLFGGKFLSLISKLTTINEDLNLFLLRSLSSTVSKRNGMKSVELGSSSISKNKQYPSGFQSSRIQIGTDQGKEKGEQTVNDEMQFCRSDLTMQFCTNLYYSALSSWCGFATICDF